MGPIKKSTVATRINQGTKSLKNISVVCINKKAPPKAPVITKSNNNKRRYLSILIRDFLKPITAPK